MRRGWFSLLLSVCLLLAQQGLVTHQIAHLGHAAAAGAGGSPDEDQGPCLSCLGHADLESAVHTDAFPPRLAAAAVEAPAGQHLAATPYGTVQARSRGPPFVL